jgi:hypothetical protein
VATMARVAPGGAGMQGPDPVITGIKR